MPAVAAPRVSSACGEKVKADYAVGSSAPGYAAGMARRLLAGLIVAAACGVFVTAAGGQLPLLRSARTVHGHVVIRVSVGDLQPVEFTAATRSAVDVDGALLAKNVRLRETIKLPSSASGVVRWRSPQALRPGTYFVQVMAVETGGVTDCPPKQRNCYERWSNVLRVVVPKSS